ncbi:MAG TPA: hypothetical protein VIN58_02160, partial [Roseateles sp.]
VISFVPAQGTPYGQLTPDQRAVVDQILRPSEDAAFAALTAAQQATVLAYVQAGDASGHAVQFYNYQATPERRLVTSFTQGVVTDYRNDQIAWGSAGAPAPGTAFASLTHDQQLAVAHALGYDMVTGPSFYKAGAAPGLQLVTGFQSGGAADADYSQIDWGGTAQPADGVGFEQLTLAQRDIVLTALGYAEVHREVYVDLAADDVAKQVLGTLTADVDYHLDGVDWGDVPAALPGTAFADMTSRQQDRVLASAGYQRWNGDVFARLSGAPDYRISFTSGVDYQPGNVRWSAVDVPTSATPFDALDVAQQARVLAQTGFQHYAATAPVFYKGDAPDGLQLRTTFTLGVDYTDSSAADPNAKRWVLQDASGHRYIAYAYDASNDGIVDELRVLEPHPLFGQRGAGFLLTGTLTTLQANADVSLHTRDDIIIQGNVNLLGNGADLTLESDRWVYWQGQAEIHGDITLIGHGAPEAGKPGEGTSVYVHGSSTLNALAAGATITVDGARDVELHGALVAGGSINANGVEWLGPDSRVSVTAGEQVLIDTALTAARSVTVTTTGTPGADDAGWGIVMTSAGGIGVPGFTSNASGGRVTLSSASGITLAGTIVSGATVSQTFGSNGGLLSETFAWSDEPSRISISAGGQLWLGGMTRAASGNLVEIGATIRAADSVTLSGGASADGLGVRLP